MNKGGTFSVERDATPVHVELVYKYTKNIRWLLLSKWQLKMCYTGGSGKYYLLATGKNLNSTLKGFTSLVRYFWVSFFSC